jgi:hypothetical protein
MGLRLLARGPVRAACAAMVLLAGLPGVAAADVCMTIDETMDTFTPKDRMAALLLLARQFELAGERVVAPGCQTAYVVSHVQLGDSITITLIGPNGRRDAVAVGMNDVAAVYSQMLRSLLTGQPMNGGGIVDRTNVSEGQTRQRRVSADSVAYARLGFGAIFGDRVYSGPAVGVFGYRKELDAFAIDVSLGLGWQRGGGR